MPGSERTRVRLSRMPRRTVLLSALLLAACGGEEPPPAPAFAPPDFSYLLPLRLNVAAIQVVDRYVPSGQPPDVSGLDPISPSAVLEQMARQRLQALGTTGRAVFVVDDASLVRVGDTVTGTMRVELNITEGSDVPAGFAQATVVRSYTGELNDMSAVLYNLTRQMMDQMNVEFEYQVRHSLGKWLLPQGAAAAPVEATPLQPPGSPGQSPPPSTPGAGNVPPSDMLAPPLPPVPPPSTS